MENNLLDLCSIVHDEVEELLANWDGHIEDADDGEEHPAKQAKDIVAMRLTGTINFLKLLKDEIQSTSMEQLRKKYNIG